MAELQTHSSVPARWRFLFAATVPLLFFAATLILSRPEPAPDPDSAPGDESSNAVIRLRAAAIAFSSGKLDPGIAIVTDRPDIYAPERDPDPGDDPPALWARMTDGGVEFSIVQPLPREFRPFFSPFSGFPVIVDPRDGKRWNIFLNGKRSPGRFDMILLDCAFPARVTSPGIGLWTEQTFAALARSRAKAGAVFAVALPDDRPRAAACVMTAMKNVFGNAGTIRFGERIVAVSSVPVSAATPPEGIKDALRRPSLDNGETQPPVFDLDDINERANLAGYYAGGDVPPDAISVVLERECSDTPPAWLQEAMQENSKRFGRNIGPLAYVRAEIPPRLRKLLPGGLLRGRLLAWTLAAALLVYLVLRYFISWKPVHKQAFLAFEDMFLFTGCLSLFGMALIDYMPSPLPDLRWVWSAALPSISLVFLLGFKRPREVRRGTAKRVVYLLMACAFYALAFWLERLSAPNGLPRQLLTLILFLLPLGFLSDLVQFRIQEPVQPGPAIPLAFMLGVAASLAVFAASLLFPAGPVVFAALICGFRLVFLDN